MEKVLIFGHKSPDTDSICSSLVMESLAKHYSLDAKAVRLGNLNKETEYILNHLDIGLSFSNFLCHSFIVFISINGTFIANFIIMCKIFNFFQNRINFFLFYISQF